MLRERLLTLADPAYREFMVKLIPNIDPSVILGVRTPVLRRLAKEMQGREVFLNTLPHHSFEENQLHCFLLEDERDFETTISRVDGFLPYVDNWATCDQLRPSVFRSHKKELLPHIRRWLRSDHPYTIRFAMEMLMLHYLDEDFDPEYPALVATIVQADYYVQMMQAWYFATALAKQYDAAFPYISAYRLNPWVHNKAIQKAIESNRIPQETKLLLRAFRIKPNTSITATGGIT